MSIAFKCDICNTYFDYDPSMKEIYTKGIIRFPSREIEKAPEDYKEHCRECSGKQRIIHVAFHEFMLERRRCERQKLKIEKILTIKLD